MTKLWEENVFRGRDAAGVAYAHNRQVMFVKQKGTAVDLAKAMDADTWANITRSALGLLHTRAATQGSTADNVNNHPVVAYNWVVTHNGIISNDDRLFSYFNVTRPAAVDSVAVNLLLGRGQTVEESLSHAATLRGSATVAAMNVARPDEVVLFRINGSPVHLFWLPSYQMVVWSSDGDGHKAIMDKIGGFADLATVYGLPDNTALHLTPEGLKKYSITPKPFGPVYSGKVYGGGSHFFPGSRTTSGTATATSRKGFSHLLPGQSLAILRESTGLLEDPIFTGSRQEYHYISRYEGYVPGYGKGTFVLPTGYGRWMLTRTEKGEIVREFKPHKRVRRRWEREFGDDNGGPLYQVQLPASGSQQEDLSDLLALGVVDLMLADGNSQDALICPWCGALRHPSGWASREYTCEWCEVQSRPPKQKSSEGGEV